MNERSKYKPPKAARWLLAAVANYDEKKAILGDLQEEYAEMAEKKGIVRAKLWYWILVLISLPSFFRQIYYGSISMFKNYFRVSLRVLKRNKGFTFINIIGLSLGLTAAILIGIYLRHEMSFDHHHEYADRIFRVCAQFGSPPRNGAYTVPPMAEAMMEELPEVEQAVRMSLWPRNYLVKNKDKAFLEKGLIFADGNIFEVFTIPFIYGNPERALIDPNTLVLSQKSAHKYFGNQNPIGKTLRFDDIKKDFLITGVVENCPAASHFQYEMIGSLTSLQSSRDTGWGGHTYFTYLLLREGIQLEQLNAKLPDFVKKHWGAYVMAESGKTWEELQRDKQRHYTYVLEPLLDIHLNSIVFDYLSIKGNRRTLFLFSTTAVLILVIACINFMNLATARFSHRTKEVSVRKVLGSNRRQLMLQFLGESGQLAVLSLVLSVILIHLILPIFSRLAERDLSFSLFQDLNFLALMIALALIVGFISGSYPAVFLSALPPIRILKSGTGKKKRGPVFLRRTLVTFQFAATFAVLFGTLVISSQLNFLQNRDLGFDKEHILVIHRAYQIGNQADSFKQELLKNPEIMTISDTDTLPGRHYDDNGHKVEGRSAADEYSIFTMYADHKLNELLDLKIVEGRYFSPEIASDWEEAVVINETAVRELQLKNPIGTRFLKEFRDAKPGEYVTVIGVVKDFNFQSLHNHIQPMIIRPLSPREWAFTSLKIKSSDLPATLGKIEQSWKKISGGQPFEYSFLDEDFNDLYHKEKRSGQILAVFGVTAITIACLGLFGLVSYLAERKTKEIGIRKVLGAGIIRIMFLLSREVVILVGISAVLISPLAYYFMYNWLQNFAFRTSITPVMFLMTFIFLMGIAILSVSYRSLKAAAANPADILKHE